MEIEIMNDKIKRCEDEKNQQKKENERFNSITQKVKAENQNQTHNARKEGMGGASKNQYR